MSYTHLSQNERYQIHTMLDLWPVAEIATRLGRHESTIRRELARNRGERGYRPMQAQMLADERSIGSRNAACISPVIWAQALELLMVQHSPEQIAGCLPISRETVYQRVYDDCTGQLKQHLRPTLSPCASVAGSRAQHGFCDYAQNDAFSGVAATPSGCA